MGEAKRRRQKDPNFGQVPSINGVNQLQQHTNKLLDDLQNELNQEIRILISAPELPDNYEQLKNKVDNWFRNKISKYREEDCQSILIIALKYIIEYSKKNNTSSIFPLLLADVAAAYLPDKMNEEINILVKEIKS